MGYYAEKTTLKTTVPFLVKKAVEEGFTAVKFPYGKTNRMTSATVNDVNGIAHAVTTNYSYSSLFHYNVFNKNFSSPWQASGSASTLNWITYDFGANNATVINAYYIGAHAGDRRTINKNAPKKWTVYGANEDLGGSTIWTPLDMRSEVIDWRHQEKKYFKFSNSLPYRYYKFEFTETNGLVLIIDQMDLFDMGDLVSKPEQVSAAFLVSKGSSTFDKVNLYLDSGQCYTSDKTPTFSGNDMYIAIIESFNPETLEQKNMMLEVYYTARITTAFQNNDNIPVNLYADISKDRIFFATVLDNSATNAANNAAYLGLMNRYSNEGNNNALTIGTGMQFMFAHPAVMQNKAGTYFTQIVTRPVPLGYSPSVWGENVFVSPVFLEGEYEGIRGELEGVFTSRTDNLVNEDEILVGSIRYKAIIISTYGSCAFPYNCVIFKIPNTTP